MNPAVNKEIEKELTDLFDSIRVGSAKEAYVQKSVLVSLLIYHKLDTQYPEYHRYISRCLEKITQPNITREVFLKIFMNPEIDLAVADKQQLADAFSVLDPRRNGSIDVKEFLAAYTKTENYLKLPAEKRRQAEDEIEEAFFNESEQGGKITPMDFYHIVRFK